MNTQLEAIQELIRINRDAMRELAKVAETTSADYVHINNAMRMLGEQFHILLQQKEEAEAAIVTAEEGELITPSEPRGNVRVRTSMGTMAKSYTASPTETSSDTSNIYKEKRGRGAEKQFFLKDESLKPAFLAQLKRIFTARYTPNKTFLLPNDTEAKAPAFLACLYDVCIKCGITSPEAPVSDFSNMVKQAAQQCPNAKSFKTAYNTIQTAVREWKPLTGNEAHYYGINVRFHKLKPKDVPQEYKATYNRWLTLYMQVEQIYKETKA